MVSSTFAPTMGGLESYLLSVSRAMATRVDIVVAAGTTESLDFELDVRRDARLARETLLAGRGALVDDIDDDVVRSAADALFEATDDHAPDVVHMHNAHHFGPELAIAALSRFPHSVVCNTVHDHAGPAVAHSALDLAWSRLFYVSRFVAASLPSDAPSSIVPLGIDLLRFRPNWPPHSRMKSLPRPVVFHPARLLRWKGVTDSVRAIARLRQAYPNATLVLSASDTIVEDDDVGAFRRELRNLANSLALPADALRFVDVEHDDMPSAYAACDVVWYPTIADEPFGLVPLEAMACGRPVVVSASGGMSENVEDGVSGFVVPRHSPERLAAATRLLLDDSAVRERVVTGAFQRVSNFDLECHVDTLLRAYREDAS